MTNRHELPYSPRIANKPTIEFFMKFCPFNVHLFVDFCRKARYEWLKNGFEKIQSLDSSMHDLDSAG